MYVNSDNVTCFDSYAVQYFLKQIKKLIENKNITANTYRIQSNDSIICGYVSIVSIVFMVKGKSLLDYTNLFSTKKYEKNDKIILKYVQ